MKYSDTDINGNAWPAAWVDTYNNLSAQIERTHGVELKQALLDERHRFYMLCIYTAQGV